jgi:hypothetical protein
MNPNVTNQQQKYRGMLHQNTYLAQHTTGWQAASTSPTTNSIQMVIIRSRDHCEEIVKFSDGNFAVMKCRFATLVSRRQQPSCVSHARARHDSTQQWRVRSGSVFAHVFGRRASAERHRRGTVECQVQPAAACLLFLWSSRWSRAFLSVWPIRPGRCRHSQWRR